ncbi:AIR synthase-related protein [Rhodocytophaga aerolata]|uniref:AIR synthase-related protein n=1 Tax=Rhodocytophaga aerolata TaxID=455078 RepID=A0ABT8RFJ2_9BACT|nr:AIR synthase-related protein [Rhodocytophaga aerolata]MDO1450875.1 AIR synthase-related protein [Rhodocytophaga aerolata]
MSAFTDTSGKIGSKLFKEMLLPKCGASRREVLTGPGFGVDTAVIELGNGLAMAVSSDPLSLIPSIGMEASAWLSVHLLANDMATTGLAPMYAQFVLNLPTELSARSFKEYWEYIHLFCKKIGVSISGGHTGQIEGMHSTISGGGTMFLVAPTHRILTSTRAQPGDALVVTKQSALTASAILAMSFPKTVKNKAGTEIYLKACESFYQTSSLADALAASERLEPNSQLKAMHDVTEGGVVGAICEMAMASGCGFRIDDAKLPVSEVQKQICRLFDIDYRFAVGAGAMIMAVKKGLESELTAHLHSKSIPAVVVGEMTPAEEGFVLIKNGEASHIHVDEKDPYWEAFFKAIKAGLT